LTALGYSGDAIKHRMRSGRLFQVHRGVYAVGRRELTQNGRWVAAVLACGDGAALSHDSAAEFWRFRRATAEIDRVHVTVLGESRSRDDIEVHRRRELNATTKHGIRVTTPAQTLIDVAKTWNTSDLEQAIGEATLRRLVSLKALRTAAAKAGRSGAALRAVIDRFTFRVTQSELEREFLRLIAKAKLPTPETQRRFGKTRVDFYWPQIGLVVETDGAQFHANAIQQTEDRKRDQAHIRAGRIPLRVTHWQVFKEAAETTALLVDVFTSTEWRRESASSGRAA
jgi:very-short-patch-repair endonuclease